MQKGTLIANQRGDMMPKNAMIAKLRDLGAQVPEMTGQSTAQQPVGEDQVLCHRCGKVGSKLPKPPFRNEFGQAIYDKICNLCWREAIAMGTKVINELRLPMADPQAQKVWDQHIREFLGL